MSSTTQPRRATRKLSSALSERRPGDPSSTSGSTDKVADAAPADPISSIDAARLAPYSPSNSGARMAVLSGTQKVLFCVILLQGFAAGRVVLAIDPPDSKGRFDALAA